MEQKKKVRFRKKASESIARIADYITGQGYPETAKKFADKLYTFGESLAIFPGKYPVCKQKALARYQMHCAVFRKTYIFVYHVENKTVVIYNVIPGKTNPESWEI